MTLMKKRTPPLKRSARRRRLGWPLLRFDKVSSTNDLLKAEAQAGAPEGCTILAKEQTQGRGRQGKQWISPVGQGVYMSLLLRPPWPAADAALLNMWAVTAVARALEKIGLNNIQVKWPNDVLARGKKIAGILVEPRLSQQHIDFVVVGVGINVRQRQKDLHGPLSGTATSCRLEGARADCERVFNQVLREMEAGYDQIRHNQKDSILEAWAQRCITT